MRNLSALIATLALALISGRMAFCQENEHSLFSSQNRTTEEVEVLTRQSALASSAVFLKNPVPHYYEWQEDENAQNLGKYWCGHAAIKMAGKYKTGEYHTLYKIHAGFYTGSDGYKANRGGHWVASLQDLWWYAQKSYGFNRPQSIWRSVNTVSELLQRIKDGVSNDFPSIIPSTYDCGYGHFYVIVGYYEGKTPGDSIVYMRDAILEKPVNTWYDKTATVEQLFNNFPPSDNGRQILFVK